MYITREQADQYDRDGFLLVEQAFSAAEVEKMLAAVEGGSRVAASKYGSADSTGKKANLALWFDLGDDIWSAASTCPRIVNNVRILMREEISFFHGKVMLKEAHSGGAWEWHQDYGYWYDQGFVSPNLISVFIALDPATRANGCLRVLKGSHKLGRLDHGKVGSQTGADPRRIETIEGMLETVYCEMTPGSALFFHSNLLHTSAANESDYHRRAFIVCYNAWGNEQLVDGKRVKREPCPVGSEDALLRV